MKQLAKFSIDSHTLRYSKFVPRLYNLVVSLGFSEGRIMPSQAFCSDENQGFPILLITKHFGTFPFSHGKDAGTVATNRHLALTRHGQDLVIFQASHVGYQQSTKRFGSYRRNQTDGAHTSADCETISHHLRWYQDEYRFAQENILLERVDGELLIRINNQFLDSRRREGLSLHLEKILRQDAVGSFEPVDILSTEKVFVPSTRFKERCRDLSLEGKSPIGDYLTADYFSYQCNPNRGALQSQIEKNLLPHMPQIVTAAEPLLQAAKINTVVEFDRVFRILSKETLLRGRRIFLVSGLNIDISPEVDRLFPLTKFIPWAGYYQDVDGSHVIYEQHELWRLLQSQPESNHNEIEMERAIKIMDSAAEVTVSHC